MNPKSAFTLIEVVISLLIVSITFFAFSELITQNIQVAERTSQLSDVSQKQLNLITLYAVEPSLDSKNLDTFFPNSSIDYQNIGSLGIYQEISIELVNQDYQLTITILR